MLKTLSRMTVAAAVVAIPLAGCGGGSSSGSVGSVSGADVTVHAQDSLKFDKTTYNVKAGEVTIGYVDDGSLTHTLVIKDNSSFKLQVSGRGDSKSGKVTLTPGSYTIFCDVPGHESAGMKATLTVS